MRCRFLVPPFLLVTWAALWLRADTIHGLVLETHSDLPVASAEVRVSKAGARQALAELESDSHGKFELPDLATGEYRIEVAKGNYTSSLLRLLVAADSLAAPAITIRMVRHGVISGQVSDQQGRAVPDAYVSALKQPAGRERGPPAVRTDEQGRFRIHDLAPGQYIVAVSYGASTMGVGSSGSAQVSDEVGSGTLLYPNNAQPKVFVIGGGEEFANTDFALSHGTLVAVSGRVEAPPNSGSGSFWLALTNPNLPGLSVATAQSSGDGTFRFDGISPGSYSLLVSGPTTARSAQGGVPGPNPLFARANVEVGGEEVKGLIVSAQPGRSAAVVLRAPPGVPGDACPSTATLALTPLEDWGSLLDVNVTLRLNAEKKLEHLAPGPYRVLSTVASENCFGSGEMTINFAQPQSNPIQVMMNPAASIHGRLTGLTKPRNLTVALFDSEGNRDGRLQEAIPDADSRFMFAGLHPGRYTVAALASDGRETRINVELKGGSGIDIELAVPSEADR